MLREEVYWWYESAKKNLIRAKKAYDEEDYEAASFWAHQTVEFALKAFIVFTGKLPPRSHNLIRLHESVKFQIDIDHQTLSELTPYYSISRYLDIFMGIPSVHKNTAKKFIEFAETVLTKVGDLIGRK